MKLPKENEGNIGDILQNVIMLINLDKIIFSIFQSYENTIKKLILSNNFVTFKFILFF